jgi:hypothetical protein
MKVYHGTNIRFDRIDLSKCSLSNDFGKGFYVTAIKQHADQRAADIAERFGGDPVTIEFDFDEKYLTDSSYRILVFDTPCREWVEFVMKNRDRTITKPVHNFDIVAGPIADDKMRRQFDRYEMKEISMEQLLERIIYREPTHQIMLGTPAAVALIQPDNTFVSITEDIITNMGVALVTNFKIDIIEAMKIIYNSETFISLTNKETGLFKKSWPEIYEMLKKESGM